jgi:Zn-dependent peptidase ImmA (M78 family)
MVYRDGDRIVVGVNSLHHPNRQRFTIAHEIGHLLLHRGKEVHIDRTFRVNLRDDVSSKAVDQEEIQANRFAAELLMPRGMLIEDLKTQQIDYENEEALGELAKRYRVSLQAMTFRLANLGLVTLP